MNTRYLVHLLATLIIVGLAACSSGDKDSVPVDGADEQQAPINDQPSDSPPEGNDAENSNVDDPDTSDNPGDAPFEGGNGTGSTTNSLNDKSALPIAVAVSGPAAALSRSVIQIVAVLISPNEQMNVRNRLRNDLKLDCESGGSVGYLNNDEASLELIDFFIRINDCRINGSTIDGTLSGKFRSGSTENSGTVTITFAPLATVEGSNKSSIAGALDVKYSATAELLKLKISGFGVDIDIENETVSYKGIDLAISQQLPTGRNTIEGELTADTTTYGSMKMTISPALLTNESDSYPSLGVATIAHSGGGTVVVDANSGAPNLFLYTVNWLGQSVTSMGEWSLIYPSNLRTQPWTPGILVGHKI